MQALSQLSYGPISGEDKAGRWSPPFMWAASIPAPCQDQAFVGLNLESARKHAALRGAKKNGSALVVVLANPDDISHVVVFFLIVGEESVVVVFVAEIDIFLVLDVDSVVAALGVLVGFLK